MFQEMMVALGVGGAATPFLGSDANDGDVSWNYNAKIVVMSLIGDSFNQTFIFDLMGDRMWQLVNGQYNNEWKLHNPSWLPYTATSRSFRMTQQYSGNTVQMILPLDVDFPTSIT